MDPIKFECKTVAKYMIVIIQRYEGFVSEKTSGSRVLTLSCCLSDGMQLRLLPISTICPDCLLLFAIF